MTFAKIHSWRSAHSRTATLFISATELLLLAALYSYFIVKDTVPLPGLVLLGALWLVRWVLTGRLTFSTPFDVPILGLLLMLAVSLAVSTDWSLSLPKVYGTVLGIAIFYALVNALYSWRRLKLAVASTIVLAGAVALVGVVGTDWGSSKIFNLSTLYNHIPRLISGVARSIQGGFHPNVVGGTLIFFIPFLVNLLWSACDFDLAGLVPSGWLDRFVRKSYRPVLVIASALTLLALLLTQSRGSILGLSVALLALAAVHDRRFLWGFAIAALGVLVLVWVVGPANLLEAVTRMDVAGGGRTLFARLEIWQRALLLVRDFPVTGVGIGTFYPVVQALYPFFDLTQVIPHAHNIVLTTAVDLGLPGLALYASLWSGFGFIAWKAYRVGDKPARLLLLGLAGGMLAHLVFSLTDSFELGTKSGAILWIFLGLAVALYLHREELAGQPATASPAPDRPGLFHQRLNRFGSSALVFACWVLGSILSVALLALQPLLGLLFAVAFGILLAFISLRSLHVATHFVGKQSDA